eukprot:5808006-Amphidinium_carterae.1
MRSSALRDGKVTLSECRTVCESNLTCRAGLSHFQSAKSVILADRGNFVPSQKAYAQHNPIDSKSNVKV